MSIDFSRQFGAGSNNNTSNTKDQPKAQVWINIGYYVDLPVEGGGTEKRFVSLPVGIPLDTMEHVRADQNNANYAGFQAARNQLLDDLIALAGDLKPGAEGAVPLAIQMRRVEEKRAAATVSEDSPFARAEPLKLVA